jgi:DNA-binding NtrC family response regulator
VTSPWPLAPDTIAQLRAVGLSTTPAPADNLTRPALGEQLEDVERAAIVKALEQARYNKTAAAKALGMTFRALRYRIQEARNRVTTCDAERHLVTRLRPRRAE